MGSFPFSAIVGQGEMKRALLIAAVDARIGGVMIGGRLYDAATLNEEVTGTRKRLPHYWE